MSLAPRLARDAFTRRSGTVDPDTGRYTPKGKAKVRTKDERRRDWKAEFDLETVRRHRRRMPHPPNAIRKAKPVKVDSYIRRGPSASETAQANREWVAYLADYYHVSLAEARKMERDSRP